MPHKRVPELPELTSLAVGDTFYVVDVSDTTDHATGSSRYINVGNMSSVFNVVEYGADPTGAVDSTTEIKAAIAAADAAKQAGNSGVFGVLDATSGTSPVVFFPEGVYTVTASLTTTSSAGTNYVRYVGEGAVLVDTTQTVTCFDGISWDVGFTGMKFRGFDTQISIDTNNVDQAKFFIRDGEFIDPASYGILTSSDSNSSLMTIENCRFAFDETVAVLADMTMDWVQFRDCWFRSETTVSFISRDAMHFEDCVFVPTGTNSGKYWIENRGQRLHIENCRIGGEGGGRTLTYHYTDLDASGTINPVFLIIENCELYATGEVIRLYGLPNVLKIEHMMDDSPTTSADGIWVDSALTAQEIKDFARFGTIDIDPRWGRIRVINNTEVATMFTLKNLKTHPEVITDRRIPIADVISSGDHSSGWTVTHTTTASATTNEYGATVQTLTANSDGDSVWLYDPNFLIEAELSKKVYTMFHEISWEPASSLGPCELYADAGHERYIIDLIPGTHMYSFPFLYLNGGSGSADTDLDNIQYQTGARLLNGDIIRFGRWFLLENYHRVDTINVEMVDGSVPVAISGTVGPNQSFFIGDICWNNAPAAAGTVGWICTTAGDAGTWKTFGTIAS